MDGVSLTADWHARWAGRVERIGAARNGLAVATGLLGLAAVIEAFARAAVAAHATPASATQNQAALFLGLGVLYSVLGLATTLPLAFLRPAPAAVVLSAASLLSLGLFHFLTLAGAAAELVAVYRSGRGGTRRGGDAAGGTHFDGAQYAALGLSVPFLVLALVTGAAGAERIPGCSWSCSRRWSRPRRGPG